MPKQIVCCVKGYEKYKFENMKKEKKVLNILKIMVALMKRIHWSILVIIILCILILGVLGYMSMSATPPKEMPPNLVTTLSSIIFGLIGYGVGKSD